MVRKSRLFALCGSLAFAGAFLALTACGSDSSTSSKEESVNVFDSKDDLPECSDSLGLDSAYVGADSALYVCADGKWTAADSSDTETSSSSDAKNSSGSKGSSSSANGSSSSEKSGTSSSSGEVNSSSSSVNASCSSQASSSSIESSSSAIPTCTEKSVNTVIGDSSCVETDGEYAFREATSIEKATGHICAKKNFDLVSSGYICRKDSSGAYKWRLATSGERATGKKCSMESQYELDSGYVCMATGYGDADSLSALEQFFCLFATIAADSAGTMEILSSGTFAASDCNFWREETDREKFLGKTCIAGVNDSQYVFKDSLFLCKGGAWEISTEPLVMDERDGQVYRTVQIGTQVWMAENLNFDYNEGSAKSYCYNDDAQYCETYGRLYTWAAAVDSAAAFSSSAKGCGKGETCSATGKVRGVCLEGWHLPDTTEWRTLLAYVSANMTGESVALALKATSGWSGYNGYDEFGFGALPAGDRYTSSSGSVQEKARFWSLTEQDAYSGYHFVINHYYIYQISDLIKTYAVSVRCLKD